MEDLKKIPIKSKLMTVGQFREESGILNLNHYCGMKRAPNRGASKRPAVRKDGSKCTQKKKGSAVASKRPDQATCSMQDGAIQDDIPSVSSVDVYVQQLVQEKGYTFVDRLGSTIILQDFNLDLRQLQRHIFRFVSRRSVKFIDCYDWAYACSCNPSNHDLIWNMDCCQQVKYIDFLAGHETCLHIETSQRLLSSIEGISGIDAESTFHSTPADMDGSNDHGYASNSGIVSPVFILNGSHEVPHLGVIMSSHTCDRIGVVKCEDDKTICIMCNRPCSHTSFLKSYRENMTHDNTPESIQQIFENMGSPKVPKNREKRSFKPISFKPIPFHMTQDLKMKINSGFKKLAYQDLTTGRYIVLPDGNLCHHCGHEIIIQEFTATCEDVPVFLRDEIARADVFSVTCSMCGRVVPCDGQESSVLNMGQFLIGYDVLRDYLNNFLHGSRPVYTYFRVWEDNLDDRGIEHSELTYHRFLNAWYGFLGLMDVDFSTGFSCPLCEKNGGSPQIIICDGTALSFRRDMMTVHAEPEETCFFERTSSRVFLRSKQTRELLQRYCSLATGMSERDYGLLLSAISTDHHTLHMFLLFIDDGSRRCPPPYRRFLLDISRNFPVCSMLPSSPAVGDLVQMLLSGVNIRQLPGKWAALQRHVPLLFDLFCADASLIPLPRALHELIEDMWDVSKQPFRQSTSLIHQCDSVPSKPRAYFPSLPLLHCRGRYGADRSPPDSSCDKTFRGHPFLLPGIFTIFCEHGICYGFEIMESCESANIPFSIFNTRFTKAPSVVIYDFACNLHAYCLNRDPIFFQETRFLVDRFHWKNHKACPSSYHLSSYPSLSHLNSQVNEQANAGLKKIKGQLSYMSEDHFLSHCKLYLYNKNHHLQKSLLGSH